MIRWRAPAVVDLVGRSPPQVPAGVLAVGPPGQSPVDRWPRSWVSQIRPTTIIPAVTVAASGLAHSFTPVDRPTAVASIEACTALPGLAGGQQGPPLHPGHQDHDAHQQHARRGHQGGLLEPPGAGADGGGGQPAQGVEQAGGRHRRRQVPQVARQGHRVAGHHRRPGLAVAGQEAGQGGGGGQGGGRGGDAVEHEGQRRGVGGGVGQPGEVDHGHRIGPVDHDGQGGGPGPGGQGQQLAAGGQEAVPPGEAHDLEQHPAQHPVQVGEQVEHAVGVAEAQGLQGQEGPGAGRRHTAGPATEEGQHVGGDCRVDRVVGQEPQGDGGAHGPGGGQRYQPAAVGGVDQGVVDDEGQAQQAEPGGGQHHGGGDHAANRATTQSWGRPPWAVWASSDMALEKPPTTKNRGITWKNQLRKASRGASWRALPAIRWPPPSTPMATAIQWPRATRPMAPTR